MTAPIASSLPQPVRRGPVLTRRGWGMVVVAVVMVGAGVWLHEVALVHMALFFVGLLGVAWWLARENLRGIGVERRGRAARLSASGFRCRCG
jgi:hypothetical protein